MRNKKVAGYFLTKKHIEYLANVHLNFVKIPPILSEEFIMQTVTINIQNETLAKKVLWMLEHFKNDGLEIVSKEDIEDLKLLKATRDDESVSFEQYLTDETKR
jgi:hypothetical protein